EKDLLTARLWLNHVGERKHYSDTELETFDAYTLVNFSATYQIWQMSRSKWELLFSAENIFDETYQQKEGYPMPGATVIGGIRVKI
ncbi:MAG: TonB-dependent receptor, partial [Desulfobacteraceae bacterium]